MRAWKGGTRLGIDIYSGEGWRATVGRCAAGRPAGYLDIKQNALRTRYFENSWTGELKAMLESDGYLADIEAGPVIADDWLCRRFDCAAA
jgi:hypothetical protein